MSHPFGDLLSHHLHRKHGLSQAKLAAGILQDPAVIAQMCHGRRLTGRQGERVVAIIKWLHDQGVLDTAAEADALLMAAGMAPLNVAVPAEQALQRRLQSPALNATVQSQRLARESRLPVAAGPLIGRHQELMGVVQCLVGPACRLLNLVGPGGIGKTRLALEAAHAVGDYFTHGVFWANLQPIQDPAGLATAIADALALPLTGHDTEAAQLVHYLRNKHLLLILDNFEQLVTAADLLVEIVAQAPQVTLLVTSREAIHVQAEWLYPIGSLAIPAAGEGGGGDPTWEEIAPYAAVQLFVTRACQLQPAFAPETQCGPIVRICRMTGGMPLALVLAAAWIPSLTCTEIADELAADLALLSTKLPRRAGTPPHDTGGLRAELAAAGGKRAGGLPAPGPLSRRLPARGSTAGGRRCAAAPGRAGRPLLANAE